MSKFFRFQLDSAGFWTSIVCALHCALMPIVLLFFSFGSLATLDHSFIEPLIIGTSFLLASFSIYPGYLRHRKFAAIFYSIGGFTLIGMSRLDIPDITAIVMMTGGALMIAMAHYTNWKLSQSANQ